MRSRLAWGLFTLVSAACAPPDARLDGGTECGGGSGRLEVGSGGARLRALPLDGGELPIVLGSQGGIHVVVGAWVRGMDLTLHLHYHLEDAESAESVGEPTDLDLRPALFSAAGTRYERHPDLVVLDNDAPTVEAFADRRVALVAEAVSSDGSHPCDRRVVTLRAPSDP